MKKLLLLLTVAGMLAIACESNGGIEEENGGNPSTPKIELSQQSIEVDFEPNTYTVSVTSPYSWKAESDNDWIIVKSKTGIAGTETLSFSIERNVKEEIRKGTITVTNSTYNLATEFYVTQKAISPKITLDKKELNFNVEGGEQSVKIIANFEYEVSTTADWVTYTKTENGITVSAPNYAEVKERTAEITISNEKYGVSKNVTVSQAGMSEEEYAKCFIFYTSSDNRVITPYKTDAFGANIVSNTYENGKGIIKFDAPVTSIGEYAFYYCSSLTSVTIPDRVTSIGEDAFDGCSRLTSVTIPDSVTSIGSYAFRGCSSLTSVIIPDSVTSIGDFAFYNCSSLASVTIGNSVTSIGSYAFRGCSSLTSITIPDSVTSIEWYAFYGCSRLTSVTIPDSVTSIGGWAFRDCSSLTSVTIPDSVTSIGEYAFDGCSSLTSVTIPDSVTSIGGWAFRDCSSLTSITIPNSVTSIGELAFYGCSSLTSITIPNSVTSIGNYAFKGCGSLTSVYISDLSAWCKIGFESDTSNPLCYGKGKLYIGGIEAKEIVVPSDITEIKQYAFCNCSSLTSVTIGNSVTSIGGYAFYDCSSLTNVTIGNSVTSIGSSAFYKCSSLTSVTIGNSVTSIGGYAFYNCSSLKNVYCKPTTPPSGRSSIFFNNAYGRKIYVPRTSVNAYKSAEYWSDYASDIVGYDF